LIFGLELMITSIWSAVVQFFNNSKKLYLKIKEVLPRKADCYNCTIINTISYFFIGKIIPIIYKIYCPFKCEYYCNKCFAK